MADWSDTADHIAERHDLTPAEVNEALADPNRVVLNPDPAQRPGGRGVRIIGFSITANAVLSVIVVEHEGIVHGATAFPSNAHDQRIYHQE